MLQIAPSGEMLSRCTYYALSNIDHQSLPKFEITRNDAALVPLVVESPQTIQNGLITRQEGFSLSSTGLTRPNNGIEHNFTSARLQHSHSHGPA